MSSSQSGTKEKTQIPRGKSDQWPETIRWLPQTNQSCFYSHLLTIYEDDMLHFFLWSLNTLDLAAAQLLWVYSVFRVARMYVCGPVRTRNHLQGAQLLKGTVARDFLVSLFYGSTLYGPKISRLKGFSFLFRFREAIRIFRWICTVGYCGDSKLVL